MRNIYFELTREFNAEGPIAALSSGQAVVYYRIALLEAHQKCCDLALEHLPQEVVAQEDEDGDAQ